MLGCNKTKYRGSRVQMEPVCKKVKNDVNDDDNDGTNKNNNNDTEMFCTNTPPYHDWDEEKDCEIPVDHQCPTCNSPICKPCFDDNKWCITMGEDSGAIEFPNHCMTCKKRICNNCARMCCIGEAASCTTQIGLMECRDCAKNKYTVRLLCAHKYLWLCAGHETEPCPACHAEQNALAKSCSGYEHDYYSASLGERKKNTETL